MNTTSQYDSVVPVMRGIGDVMRREPETADSANTIPAGTTVVSTDGHWVEGDFFVEYFPDHLKDRAPRILFEDGGWQVVVDGKRLGAEGASAGQCDAFECLPGANNATQRLADYDAEGVDKELLFPQKFFHLLEVEDPEVKEWNARAYNLGLRDFCSNAPDRLHGVGMLNWWDPDATRDSIAEIKDLGFKTMMVPMSPGFHADGEPVVYSSARMDPFWDAIEESGMPLCFHIGERPIGVHESMRGAHGSFTFNNFMNMRTQWGRMVFSGIFDRKPKLKIAFVEGGLHWIPGALQDADMIFESFGTTATRYTPKLEFPPSYYWRNNCYATFTYDAVGLATMDRIGADRVMWASDYPHNEGSFGYTRSAVREVFDALPDSDAKKIVGGTAIELFGL